MGECKIVRKAATQESSGGTNLFVLNNNDSVAKAIDSTNFTVLANNDNRANVTNNMSQLTSSNISTYFSVTNGDYYFNGSDGTWTSTNHNVDDSTAQSTWTALHDMRVYSLLWSVSSEVECDCFSLSIAGETVVNAASGTNSRALSFVLTAGQTIVMEYQKDWSGASEPDIATVSNVYFEVI